jgi:phosphate:Na+ symporter
MEYEMDSANMTDPFQIGAIIVGLLGGLALFLFGLEQMTDALKIVTGNRLRRLLARLTTNRFKAVFTGAVVTAVIQSSSVTTVLVVGFVSAGLLTLTQSIGIIMGAEIGTTITAQIIAFKVTQFAVVLIIIGFGLQFTARRQRLRQYGLMTMGFGLIFFGMNQMSEATRPLRSYAPFIQMMFQLQNPLLAILAGALFTAIVQSSSATIGIIIVLASQGFITLETGIALTFGANIGTSVTAMLASIGKPAEAVQTALIHVLFNVLGVFLWFGFIDELAGLVRWLSPQAVGLSGTARLAAETPRQIANAHTIFNVTNTFIFIWFTTPLAWLVRHLVSERLAVGPARVRPRYLDENLFETPELALDRVRLELGRLGELTLKMVREALPTVFHGSEEDLEVLAGMDDDVDGLHAAIVLYLGRLSRKGLLKRQSDELSDYMAAANHFENIGDMVETNMVEAGSTRLKRNVEMSEATQEKLRTLHLKVCWAVEAAGQALVESDQQLAEEVMAAKLEINQLALAAENHLANRLVAEEPNRLATFRIESEIIEYLKRVYYFAKRIAKFVAEADLVYRQVELKPVSEAEVME